MSGGVSAILLCFRQERYVREALCGLLVQAGPPIEIVASDDASDDGTFEVLREVAAADRGPHRVVVRRNATRLGLAGNLNAAVEAATGDFLVVAAGDDVSRPDRVETLRQLRSSTGASSVFSNARIVDADGRGRGLFAADGFAPLASWRPVLVGGLPVFGCAHAFDRALYDVFGPLPDDVALEDRALGLRALLLCGIAYTPQPLVDYRRHDGNLSRDGNHARGLDRESYAEYLAGVLRARAALQRSFARDLETAAARGLVSGAGREQTRAMKRVRLLEAGAELVLGRRSLAAYVSALPSTLTADLVIQAAKCLLLRAAPGLRDWTRGRAAPGPTGAGR